MQILGNIKFLGIVAVIALALIGAIVSGMDQFQAPVGMIVVISAGVLVLPLVAFVLFVAWSAINGQPMQTSTEPWMIAEKSPSLR